ncbi:MAG TPA: DUF5989 family protein [Polyangia bacterium]|jgi:hypothetical protein|nr:DUF5989 family protein [Polyangia bacterium]
MDEQRPDDPADEFKSAAAKAKPSLLKDFFGLLAQNKKWWLLPLIVVLVGLGVLAILGGTAAAPFIYTLF